MNTEIEDHANDINYHTFSFEGDLNLGFTGIALFIGKFKWIDGNNFVMTWICCISVMHCNLSFFTVAAFHSSAYLSWKDITTMAPANFSLYSAGWMTCSSAVYAAIAWTSQWSSSMSCCHSMLSTFWKGQFLRDQTVVREPSATMNYTLIIIHEFNK